MRNSGGDPAGDTDHVLDLGWGTAKSSAISLSPSPALEAIDEVLDTGSAVYDQRLPEGLSRTTSTSAAA
jgi:hypothetical protein